jgi:hypothetical protein
MGNNPKPKQMQQNSPNAMFVFFMHDLPCPSEWKTTQNQNKCSKAILMQCFFFE